MMIFANHRQNSNIYYILGPQVDARIFNSTGRQSIIFLLVSNDVILEINLSAAFSPRPYELIAIVVKAGSNLSTNGISLKPTMETSLGQL